MILGMVTFYGEEFPSDVYAWIIVLVLPVNSALNPILYTMTAVIRQKVLQSLKIRGDPMLVG